MEGLKEYLDKLVAEYDGGKCNDVYCNQCHCLDEVLEKLSRLSKSL